MSVELIGDKFDKFADVRVVKDDEVSSLTLVGWKILAILSMQETEPSYASLPVSAGNGCYTTQSATVPTVKTVIRFLMGKDRDTTIVELRDSIATANKRTAEAESATKKYAAEVETLKFNYEAAKKRYTTAEDDAKAQRERVHKFENDIAKVREAIGSQQMTKILEA